MSFEELFEDETKDWDRITDELDGLSEPTWEFLTRMLNQKQENRIVQELELRKN